MKLSELKAADIQSATIPLEPMTTATAAQLRKGPDPQLFPVPRPVPTSGKLLAARDAARKRRRARQRWQAAAIVTTGFLLGVAGAFTIAHYIAGFPLPPLPPHHDGG